MMQDRPALQQLHAFPQCFLQVQKIIFNIPSRAGIFTFAFAFTFSQVKENRFLSC